VVAKGSQALNPRGELYTDRNVYQLSVGPKLTGNFRRKAAKKKPKGK